VIDGPIVINPKHYTVYCGQSNHVDIRNIKTFSAAPWTDGIDMMACSDVNIDNVFLRTSDDSIAIYGHRWDYYGDAQNIMVTNSVLWADVAHPINIGLHGNNKQPELIENIRFNNIDILGHDEDDRNYQGAMAITNSDDNLVKNVYFENIRIDGVEEGMLFNFRVVFNEKYSHSPGRGIKNVYLKNISIVNSSLNTSVIGGYSKERAVNNIVLENIRLDGKRLKPSDFTLGEHVSDVIVKP
jgi:polygalacturonase